MSYDTSDPDAVKKARAEEKDRDKDLGVILGGPRGRRWLYNLIHETCHVDLQSYVPGNFDATAFNEGVRSVGLAVLADIQRKDPGKLLMMIKENAPDA